MTTTPSTPTAPAATTSTVALGFAEHEGWLICVGNRTLFALRVKNFCCGESASAA